MVSFLGKGPHVAIDIITRYVGQVKAEEFALDLRRAGIQILPPIRLGLLGYLQDRQKGPDIFGKPRLVDLKVVVSNADSNPAPPSEGAARAQFRLGFAGDPADTAARQEVVSSLPFIRLHRSAQAASSNLLTWSPWFPIRTRIIHGRTCWSNSVRLTPK